MDELIWQLYIMLIAMFVLNAAGSRLIQQALTLSRLHWHSEKPKLVFFYLCGFIPLPFCRLSMFLVSFLYEF